MQRKVTDCQTKGYMEGKRVVNPYNVQYIKKTIIMRKKIIRL